MRSFIFFQTGAVVAFLLMLNFSAAAKDSPVPPTVSREFRAAWVASVANIDWPSKPGLPVDTQKEELLAILQLAKKIKLNALILQVRPACDALYESQIEPWSEYLTGQMGKPPEPFYDPLKFAIEESHRLGIELHAWINPYRARHATAKSEIDSNHVSKTHPEMALKYGKMLWLDPGQQSVQDYTTAVALDIVRRYDVDGMHLDDYFYPYHEKDESGQTMDFPDETSWMEFVGDGGLMSRDDWRRENVNKLVERLFREIKALKPWVKFGVSPFGIWQPGYPEQIQGFNAYTQIYCDSRKWLTNGWCDYVAPQLYWKIEAVQQSYPALLKWWTEQNEKGRYVWPGLFTSRVDKEWSASEIVNQIEATRVQEGATGHIHFSMKPLMQNRGKITDEMTALYAEAALVPPSVSSNKALPAKPNLSASRANNEITVQWRNTGGHVWQWLLQKRIKGQWKAEILSGEKLSDATLADNVADLPDAFALSAINRYGIASEPAVFALD